MTSVRVVHTETCPDIGPICDQRDEPAQLHDQRFKIAEVRLTLAYGVWRWLGVELQAPLRVSDTSVEYQRLDGEVFTPDYPAIHHRNETLVGPGDPWLLVRGERRLGAIALTAKVGASLPLGSTEPNPFELGSLGGGGSRGFGKLALSGEADIVIERPERWDGEILQDGNLGRTDVLLGAGATYRIGRYTAGLGLKVPVYQDIVTGGDEGGQLSYPAIVDLSIEGSFDIGR